MEAKGEIELFLHSFENQNLMHITFAGDGYSGCFGSVREECEKSRIGYIVKEGCVGHIQKWLWTILRQFNLRMHRTIVPDGEKTVDRGGRISGWQKK